jgi:hypothetical protein
MQTAVNKALRVGKATMLAIGLGVSLAILLGVATAALAAVPGDPFKLGKSNKINAVSTLVGNVAGPMLTIDNDSTSFGATALDLRVEPGKAPLKVNSDVRVSQLNADEVDGFGSSDLLTESGDRNDFLPSDTYIRTSNFVNGPGNFQGIDLSASCDSGDLALGGGGQSVGFQDHLNQSFPSDSNTWAVEWEDQSSAGTFQAYVICADFPPGR